MNTPSHYIYRTIILDSFQWILERSRNTPLLNTKFDLFRHLDCYDITEGPDRFRGKEVVYSWIQGRGVESLAVHLEHGIGDTALTQQILCRLIARLEEIREKNNGRLFFMFSPEGRFLQGDLTPMTDAPAGDAGYSDLFYSKGLLKAGMVLKDAELQKRGLQYVQKVTEAIENNTFVTDQQPFDPKNKILPVPGKILQGPFMIALSGILYGAQATGSDEWVEKGCRFIQHILSLHTREQNHQLQFFEAIHTDGTPYIENGQLFCDPGHTLEFVGLAGKFLLYLQSLNRSKYQEIIQPALEKLERLLYTHFQAGYQPQAQGIAKGYDWESRALLNTDMPWWSLPETIRAAAEIQKLTGHSTEEIQLLCTHALWERYTSQQHHCFAYQTRDAKGEPIPVIPACPDLDPGYHTNLSLLDVLKLQ